MTGSGRGEEGEAGEHCGLGLLPGDAVEPLGLLDVLPGDADITSGVGGHEEDAADAVQLSGLREKNALNSSQLICLSSLVSIS
jgi:hypothetical protein